MSKSGYRSRAARGSSEALPLVSTATKLVYGKDVLAELPVRDYLARMGERAAVQKVSADRKANAAQMVERMKAGK